MHHSTHPDDERLAAYASADRDAVSDRELAGHIESCDRCRPIVNELTVLREALADLPDIAPSRPLRLIPPAADAAPRPGGVVEWLRRLAAPAMVAGVGLVLVGAVGVSGRLGGIERPGGRPGGGPVVKGRPATGAGSGHSPVPAVSTDAEFGSRSPHNQASAAAPATPAPSLAPLTRG